MISHWDADQLAAKAAVLDGQAVVANVSKRGDEALVAWAKAMDRFVYIGRPERFTAYKASSAWANPARVEGDREVALEAFAQHLAARPDLQAQLPSLRGKVLGCWCYPLVCHGDLLAALVNGLLP